MNQNSIVTYGFFLLFVKGISLTIALIMFNAPIPIIAAVNFLMFLPLFINSPTFPIVLMHIYNFIRPILYIIAMIITIQGKQDVFAIIFYVLFALQTFSIIKNLIFSVSSLIILSINK